MGIHVIIIVSKPVKVLVSPYILCSIKEKHHFLKQLLRLFVCFCIS